MIITVCQGVKSNKNKTEAGITCKHGYLPLIFFYLNVSWGNASNRVLVNNFYFTNFLRVQIYKNHFNL